MDNESGSEPVLSTVSWVVFAISFGLVIFIGYNVSVISEEIFMNENDYLMSAPVSSIPLVQEFDRFKAPPSPFEGQSDREIDKFIDRLMGKPAKPDDPCLAIPNNHNPIIVADLSYRCV